MALPDISNAVSGLLLMIVAFFLSSLPLHFAVRFLNGKTDLIKTMAVVFLSGVIVSAVKYQFKLFGSVIAFIVLIWIYHEVFRLKWLKAFIAWALQFIFVAAIYVLLVLAYAMIVGLSVIY